MSFRVDNFVTFLSVNRGFIMNFHNIASLWLLNRFTFLVLPFSLDVF